RPSLRGGLLQLHIEPGKAVLSLSPGAIDSRAARGFAAPAERRALALRLGSGRCELPLTPVDCVLQRALGGLERFPRLSVAVCPLVKQLPNGADELGGHEQEDQPEACHDQEQREVWRREHAGPPPRR